MYVCILGMALLLSVFDLSVHVYMFCMYCGVYVRYVCMCVWYMFLYVVYVFMRVCMLSCVMLCE